MSIVFLPGCGDGDDARPGGAARPIPAPRPEGLQNFVELAQAIRLPRASGFRVGHRDYPPEETVSLESFYIAPCETTQELYELVMGVNPSVGEHGDRLPVQNVSWIEAVTFCNRLSELMGYEPCYDLQNGYLCDFGKSGFRLPTSAEWEYACRGESLTPYFWGNDKSEEFCVPPLTVEQLRKIRNKLTVSFAEEVMSRKPNESGLYDMAGNVSEMCDTPYANQPTYRVYRGGSWEHHNWDAFQSKWIDRLPQDQGMSTVGFRIVRKSR